ncbi:sigma factor [Desulforamulus reducens]|uniref:sigma factor n=1 Tax=Desulforamulus reducens TaxID=59610 RepID=UPI0002FB666C|nr:sigma factor [Desulforamulus reducens]
MGYSQSALVEGIKNKDVLAYEYMINKYTKTIYCLAYNILCQSLNREDIEECVSDVFLDAWVKINDFDQEKGNFRTWLLILTKCKALIYKRKKVLQMLLLSKD